jgi:tRNA dimethylallyltransferase
LPPGVLFILGQTASGKSAAAYRAACNAEAEIISVDSAKVYRGMDIGTAKPLPEKRAAIQYHMIDIADPNEDMDVKQYTDQVNELLKDAGKRRFILAGGSALYAKVILSGVFEGAGRNPALRQELRQEAADKGAESLHARLAGVDPEAASRILPGDEKRIIRALEVYDETGRPISSLQGQFDTRRKDIRFRLAGLRHPRPVLYDRINARVDRMYEQGLVEEVARIRSGSGFGRTSSMAIGYRQVLDAWEQGKDPYSDEVRDRIKKKTRTFARKQMTWFQRFSDIAWIDIDPGGGTDTVHSQIRSMYKELWQ